jgi:hypothetical protein
LNSHGIRLRLPPSHLRHLRYSEPRPSHPRSYLHTHHTRATLFGSQTAFKPLTVVITSGIITTGEGRSRLYAEQSDGRLAQWIVAEPLRIIHSSTCVSSVQTVILLYGLAPLKQALINMSSEKVPSNSTHNANRARTSSIEG